MVVEGLDVDEVLPVPPQYVVLVLVIVPHSSDDQSEYVGPLHELQLLAPALDHWPAGHGVQLLEPELDHLPAGHWVHLKPSPSYPAEQVEQPV